MTENLDQLRGWLHAADACMADIRVLAGKLADRSADEVESLLRQCTDEGDDWAVSRLLQACACNAVKLDPGVLCRCIGVCKEMPDSAPCFGLQDERVVAPLLAEAVAETLSLERKLYASRLAAELSVKFGLDPQPVRKVLWKQEQGVLPPHYQVLVADSLRLLEKEADSPPSYALNWSELQLSDLLPEHKPRAVVGGDYTVRRPIPKLGRNDPCHCGSGNKYKRCCYAKDQELLRDASAYAGVTRSELKSRPGLVDDPDVIYNLRAYELKRLEPSELGANQLITAYHCALDYGLRELAFAMLVECERRPGEHEFDRGHFEDLIDRVLAAGDLDLARKIRDHCGDQGWYQPRAIEFRFDLLEHPERFAPLEQDCRHSVSGIPDRETEEDEPLIRLAYDCAARYPALAVVFARAAIASHPDRALDNAMLLDLIRDARVDLDLEPRNDPAEALFDWIEHRAELREKADAENEEIQRLSNRLESARAALAEKKQAVREMEQRVEELAARPEKIPEPGVKGAIQRSDPEIAGQPDREAVLRRLRDQVAGLKAEISEQQAERGRLRKLLAEERKNHSAPPAPSAPPNPTDPEAGAASLTPSGKPLLPEYTETFRKTCESLPSTLAAKAILTAGRFAAHDNAIWRHTKPIQRLSEHYRIRIGLDYRMIVHWQPGKLLRIRDVIPRQDLESWIKRHG